MLPLLGGTESSIGLRFASSVSPWVNLLWILVLFSAQILQQRKSEPVTPGATVAALN